MKITSYGATEEVTGSKHLANFNGSQVLFDCGMFQGKRLEAAHKNKDMPFAIDDIHVVVLSHAHIDHSGLLPMLIRYGYRGKIFCTPATRDLCAVMLMDSAHIQERDAKWLSKREQSFVPPLYQEEDVHETMRHFVSIPYDLPFDIAPGVRLTFRDAGHVLGSAMCEVEYQEDGEPRTFVYTGDLGRHDMPILRDPWQPERVDVLLMESTYGNRNHDPIEMLDTKLAKVINRTVERGGKVIVPTFALERAQEFIYALKRLQGAGRIPSIPVFVDSPLTVNITEVFRLHTDLFDEEIQKLMEDAGDPFQLDKIHYVRGVEESKAINGMQEPVIILSAAGMCEHGRILHHLRNNVGDKRNTICIIGYQAKNTLGRRIVERQREVRIFGIKHELLADVEIFNALSAHAGQSDLVRFGCAFKDQGTKILLVHGEQEAQTELLRLLEEGGCTNAGIQKEATPVEV